MTERERLMQIMEKENLSAKQFAIEVGIQPGTISNIMSGRNNPSLDVMQRVLQRFRTLNSDWLVLGVGQMYRQNGDVPSPALFDIRPENPNPEPSLSQQGAAKNIEKEQPVEVAPVSRREIQKILIFYTDGTFEER